MQGKQIKKGYLGVYQKEKVAVFTLIFLSRPKTTDVFLKSPANVKTVDDL